MSNKRSGQKRRLSPAEKATNVILVIVVVIVLGLSIWAVGPKVVENVKGMLPQKPGPDTSIVSGMAESLDMSVDEFKTELELGEDVTGDTPMTDIVADMPLKNYAKLFEKDYAEFVEENGLTDKVTEDTKWSEAEPKIPFGNYVGGEESFNQIKEMYGLDDTITMDTPWGEVQPVLEQKQAELAEAQATAQEMAAEDEAANDDASAENETDTEAEKAE